MNWIKSLFGLGGYKPSMPKTVEQVELPGRRAAAAAEEANADLFENGCVFSARVSLDTPLAALRRHGEHFDGLPSAAPYVCDGQFGGWCIQTKTWRSMGIELDEMKPAVASPIGPVDPADVMPFLIAFREIVESATDHQQCLARLFEMGSKPQYRPYWDRFSSAYDDFPHSYFYFSLMSLPGVGRKTAKALYQGGFHSIDQLRVMSEDKLAAVPGVGKATAAKIKAALS
jgi:hypothetical protein